MKLLRFASSKMIVFWSIPTLDVCVCVFFKGVYSNVCFTFTLGGT